MNYVEKNNDKVYCCKNVKTAIKRAIKDGIIDLRKDLGCDDLEAFEKDDYLKIVKASGFYRDFWEDKPTNTFFRFQIEELDSGKFYIDLGYRLMA